MDASLIFPHLGLERGQVVISDTPIEDLISRCLEKGRAINTLKKEVWMKCNLCMMQRLENGKKRPPPNVGAAIANELMDTTVWKGRCAAKCLVEVVPKSVQILTSSSVVQMCILNHLHDQNYLDNPLDQPLSKHMIPLKMLSAVNIITKSCPWHRGQTHFISLERQHILHQY